MILKLKSLLNMLRKLIIDLKKISKELFSLKSVNLSDPKFPDQNKDKVSQKVNPPYDNISDEVTETEVSNEPSELSDPMDHSTVSIEEFFPDTLSTSSSTAPSLN